MNRRLTKRDIRFLVFMLVVHAFWFSIALAHKRIYMGDSFEYIYMALNIKEQGWFYAGNPGMPMMPEYLTLRPPLYSLFLGLVYTFTMNNWVVLVLQNLLSVFNVFYLRDTLRKLGYSRGYDYILLAFVILYPARFVNANTIAPDLMLQTTILIYFRHFVLLMQNRRWRNGVWMSAALIAGMMVKPVLYPFAIVHCVMMMLVSRYMKNSTMRAGMVAMLPLLAAFLYMGWNGMRTGKVHFSSTQSFNAVYYYYFFFSDKYGIDSAKHFLADERAQQAALPAFSDRYDHANKRGLQLLKDNFSSYMPYHIKHSARMLIDPGKGELDMFLGHLTLGGLYTKEKGGFYSVWKEQGFAGIKRYMEMHPTMPVIIVVLLFNILRLLGFIIFLFTRSVPLYLRLFVAALVGYFCITTGPIANTRYFLPVSAVVIGCATLGYQQLLLRQKNKSIIAVQA